MILLAYDTEIFSQSNISLQLTLDNIQEWLNTRKLDLNPTKFVPVVLLINKTEIPRVEVFKDLELFISENLNWNKHINYLITSTSLILSNIKVSKMIQLII